jgi:hypothetical protein
MHTQEPHSDFADRIALVDFVPRVSEVLQSVEGLCRRLVVQRRIAIELRNC